MVEQQQTEARRPIRDDCSPGKRAVDGGLHNSRSAEEVKWTDRGRCVLKDSVQTLCGSQGGVQQMEAVVSSFCS